MSTRYVWSRRYYTVDENSSYVSLIRGSHSKEMTESTVVGYCCTAVIENRDGNDRITSYSPGGSIKALHFGEAISTSEYPEFVPSMSGSQTYGSTSSATAGYWFGVNDYTMPSGDYTAAVVYKTATPPSSGQGEISFRAVTLTPGGYGTTTYLSSANSQAYPTSSSGANEGIYWYQYLGSDSIDPQSISVSGTPKAGVPITLTVLPGTSKKYEGTVSYTYQYKQDGGSWTDISSTSSTSISFTVPIGTVSIQFRAYASDDIGFTSTDYVTSGNLALNSAPSAPASVTVMETSPRNFSVRWTASSDPDGNLSGYQVERSYNNGGTWSTVTNSTTATSLTDNVAAGNTSVTYRVRAFDAEGLYSGWTVSGMTTVSNPPTTPASITLPALINAGENYTITWAASTDPDGNLAGYQVERSTDQGGSWIRVADAHTTASFSAVATADSATVMYRVRAVDAGGLTSGWKTSTASTINTAPSAPRSVSMPEIINLKKSFTVSWTAAADAENNVTSYQVERSYDGGGTWSSVASSVKGTSLTAVENSVKDPVIYRVRAVDAGGLTSEWTASRSTAINRPPAAPSEILLGTVRLGEYATVV